MSSNVVEARQFQNKHPPRGAEEHIFQKHPYSSGIALLIMFFMPGYVLGSRLKRPLPFCGRLLNSHIIPKDVKFELSDPGLV